jgi:hypothetical protein
LLEGISSATCLISRFVIESRVRVMLARLPSLVNLLQDYSAP